MSEAERKSHNLNGELSNAEICPTKFDEKSKTHIKTGSCEWVRCQEIQGEITCQAQKNPF